MSFLQAKIPLSKIAKMTIYVNRCKKTMATVQKELGCDYIINAGMWNGDGSPCEFLKVGGQAWNMPKTFANWGYGWNSIADLAMFQSTKAGAYSNFISVAPLLTPWDGLGANLVYPSAMGGKRGRSAMGLDGNGNLVLWCSKDGSVNAKNPEQLRQIMYDLGCKTAMMFDGGGSSQCIFKSSKITASRKVHNFICIWMKDEEGDDTNMNLTNNVKKVVLDPGHGVETAGKRSPDNTYFEHEFNLDMAKRIKAQLERHGVAVTLTRSTENDVTLQKRVSISNTTSPNLFVSIHSNASGSGSTWTKPDGYGIYTSKAGATAERNIAANKILTRAKEADIALWGNGLFHNNSLYVLKNTVAPAVLIEHGFHTNYAETQLLKSDVYRQKLAEVDTKGILDYLGIDWIEEDNVHAPIVQPTVETEYTLTMPIIKRGDKGATVKAIQTLLIMKGYNFGSYGADGSFGPATEEVVKTYQANSLLKTTGIVDELTMKSLLGLL